MRTVGVVAMLDLPLGIIAGATYKFSELAASGLADYLKDTMMHHALYIEVNGGRFRGILDFSKDGLFYCVDL